MTREEAIEQLKWYFEYDNGLSADKETVEAYKMAIKALEKEPCEDCEDCEHNDGECCRLLYEESEKIEQEPCEDCVSRRAVLAMSDFIGEPPTYENPYGNNLKEVVYVEDIESLPSVTPTHVETPTEFADRCRECGKQTRWISVSERLPEYDEDIIITHKGTMKQPITSVSYFDGDFKTEDGEGHFSDVVAWQPLPKPYEAEMESE